jgi:hypothetical protein
MSGLGEENVRVSKPVEFSWNKEKNEKLKVNVHKDRRIGIGKDWCLKEWYWEGVVLIMIGRQSLD